MGVEEFVGGPGIMLEFSSSAAVPPSVRPSSFCNCLRDGGAILTCGRGKAADGKRNPGTLPAVMMETQTATMTQTARKNNASLFDMATDLDWYILCLHIKRFAASAHETGYLAPRRALISFSDYVMNAGVVSGLVEFLGKSSYRLAGTDRPIV